MGLVFSMSVIHRVKCECVVKQTDIINGNNDDKASAAVC
jgi:hypothetical protein